MKTEDLNKILEDDSLSNESRDKLIALHENISSKEFSDLLDQEGNQYIEFVQEGGGVWEALWWGTFMVLKSSGSVF